MTGPRTTPPGRGTGTDLGILPGESCPCMEPACVSLRVELAHIFGVPVVRDGETWNAAMLRHIADERGAELRQAAYVLDLAQQTVGAAENLRGRLSS